MRAFILTCLLGLAYSAPQGYNYQSGNLQLPGVPLIQQQAASIDEQRLVQQALQAPKVQQILQQTQSGYQQQTQHVHSQPQLQSQPQQFFQQPQQQQQFSNFGLNFPAQQQHHQHQQAFNPSAALVSKDIYVHVPPVEDSEEHYTQPALPPPPPRKHYRIVFIKAPTPAVSKAALRVKQAPVEEKTIIYVLTKKPDPLELQTAIEEAAPKQISKPEVFFIKYKTQEEAAHAQRTIQAQYDQLGGTTQVSDEGVAPVTSVIGALDNQRGNAVANGIGHGIGQTLANSNANANSLTSVIPNKYLPAHLRA